MSLETLYRTAILESAPAASAEGRAVKLSISSEALVLRKDGVGLFYERLSHQPGDCNLALFNRAGVVLRDHLEKEVIGTVEPNSFGIHPDRKLRGVITLTDAAWISKLNCEDIPVSCGYTWISLLREEPHQTNGLPVRTYSWRPYECSLLTGKPADDSVGIGRSADSNMKNIDQLLTLALSGSRQTEESFNDVSLAQTIRELGHAPTGRVREMHQSLTHLGGEAIDRGIPFSAFNRRQTRDSTAGIFSAGGALVQDDMHDGTPLLFNHSVTRKLGAQFITGLQGNFLKPRGTTAPVVESLAETALVTASDILTAQDALKPVRLAAQVVLSNQWLVQAGPSAEAYVRATISEAVATEMDRLVLFGQGADNEPVGLTQTVGVQSVVYGGPATWTGLLAQERALADSNIPEDSFGFAMSPSTRARWKAIPRIAATNYPSFICENNRALDYPALASNQMSGAHQTIFGAWKTLLVLVWGDGLWFVKDPYTLATKGETKLTVCLLFNILPLYPQAFVVSADAANQ